MNESAANVIAVEPVVSYPRQAQVGKTYLMTFDLRTTEGASDWPYREEEYPISVLLDAAPFFVSQPLGEPAVVLHRFGGTYGPARWLLTAARETRRGTIWVTLFGVSGAPLKAFKLDGIQVGTMDANAQTALPQPVIPETRTPGPQASAPPILRVLVTVDDAWTVTVTFPGLEEPSPYIRSMGRQLSSTGQAFPVPPTGEIPDPSAEQFIFCSGEQPEAVADAYNRIAEGEGTDVAKSFGRYLFDCLIGSAVWEAIRGVAAAKAATTVEIALLFASSSRDLNRFTWEAMASSDGFLSAGFDAATVIVTRLSESLSLLKPVTNRLIRILFVMGGNYADPLLHAGVEHLELMRHHGSPGSVWFDWRFVDNASPSQVSSLARYFRPDVVHIVCHARHDPDGGTRLLLRDGGHAVTVDAEQLINYLSTDTGPPAVIILSLCSVGRGAIGRAFDVSESAAFATALVDYGVPLVVTTGGPIADTASRLFTRQFATAMQQGLPVIPSLASSFRAAFAHVNSYAPPPTWPALFVSSGVRHTFSLVAEREGQLEIESTIRNLDLFEAPIFCARDSFIAAFEQILGPDYPNVLLVYTRDATSGLGRTRLLKEFAIKALIRGNIPVFLQAAPFGRSFGDISEVGDTLLHAIVRTRRAFRLQENPNSQLMLLRRHRAKAIEEPSLDDFIKSELGSTSEITVGIIRRAIEQDLTALADDARGRHDEIKGMAGRVVVLFDDIQALSSDSSTLLELLDMLNPSGLGRDQNIPVVIMMSLGGFADHELRSYIESSSRRAWIRIAELTPFTQTDGEDMLAYEQVWLHPGREYQLRPMVINHENPDSYKSLTSWCRLIVEGIPGKLVSTQFAALAKLSVESGSLSETDDDVLLAYEAAMFRG